MNAEPISEWVHKAEMDYEGALVLLRRRKNPLPDLVCWHSQQCAEKYSKAFLARHRVIFARTHNLTALLQLCNEIDLDFRLIAESMRYLNPFGVEIRYPGASTTVSDAREAVVAMKQIRKFVRAKLGLKMGGK
jgi:HEPN domain-containing protein